VRIGPPEKLTGSIVPNSLSTNPSGKSLVFEDSSGWAVLHTNDSSLVHLQTKHDPRKSAVSPDNRYAVIANWEAGGAATWDAETGAHLADLNIGRCGVVEFSPDGHLLAATPDGVTLWRTGDWQRVRQLHAHGTTPTGLGIAFSPDSRLLAVGQANGILRLVDPGTGNDWAHLTHFDMSVAEVMKFSPDQRYLVTSGVDDRSTTLIWDVSGMRSELERRGLDWPADVLAVAAAPSLEGELEIVLDDGGLLRQLEAATEAAAPE
jgi:WD40 repeat protein